MKIKPGSRGYPDRSGPAPVALVRAVSGEEVGLYVDANDGYSAGQAVRVGRALAEQGVV